ncbi:hypothetical protein BASA61_009654 [Batrachochytrium salamandrivorans]|nr:hypothetical protein BASA62_007478 [Batrachochytrium salamandrivorans]KAH6580422.1 hypothetical protein BASA61_009654 [Batrachochytrium salamandrivorans]KAH9268641.1 hypothetical protein BASA83_009273 [Batrachochytrium salamandrivorans]
MSYGSIHPPVSSIAALLSQFQQPPTYLPVDSSCSIHMLESAHPSHTTNSISAVGHSLRLPTTGIATRRSSGRDGSRSISVRTYACSTAAGAAAAASASETLLATGSVFADSTFDSMIPALLDPTTSYSDKQFHNGLPSPSLSSSLPSTLLLPVQHSPLPTTPHSADSCRLSISKPPSMHIPSALDIVINPASSEPTLPLLGLGTRSVSLPLPIPIHHRSCDYGFDQHLDMDLCIMDTATKLPPLPSPGLRSFSAYSTDRRSSEASIPRASTHYNYLGASSRDECDCAELIRRPSEVPLSGREMIALFGYMLSLTPSALVQFQKSARARPQESLLDCDISNLSLKFKPPHNFKPGEELSEIVTISLKGAKQSPKFTWYLPPVDERYSLSVEPTSSGRLRKTNFTFVFRLKYTTFTVLRAIVMLEVKGGYRHFFAINTESSSDIRFKPHKPARWNPSELVSDGLYIDHYRIVPNYLARLRTLLVSKSAFESFGIFREKGNPWDVETLQAKLSDGIDWDCNDVHAIATCIKLYLRDSIAPCNAIPAQSIAQCSGPACSISDQDASWEVLQTALKNDSSVWNVMLWTLDVMSYVVHESNLNQMGAKSVATAFAPNLYSLTESTSYMNVVQHLVPFLHNVLCRHMRDLRM